MWLFWLFLIAAAVFVVSALIRQHRENNERRRNVRQHLYRQQNYQAQYRQYQRQQQFPQRISAQTSTRGNTSRKYNLPSSK